jgi:hypothetical protein
MLVWNGLRAIERVAQEYLIRVCEFWFETNSRTRMLGPEKRLWRF